MDMGNREVCDYIIRLRTSMRIGGAVQRIDFIAFFQFYAYSLTPLPTGERLCARRLLRELPTSQSLDIKLHKHIEVLNTNLVFE